MAVVGGAAVKGRKVKASNSRAEVTSEMCYANEAISKWNIVVVVGQQGKFSKVEKASSLVAADCNGRLMVATAAAASGRLVRCRPLGTIEAQNTNGLTVGDRVYLGATGGGWSTTPTGFLRCVGAVQVVSATVGVIQFNGFSDASHRFISGTGSVADLQTSATITAATLGGTYGGKKVQVTLTEVATNNISLRAATWSGNDLVVTVSGDPGASGCDFNYQIEVA